MRFITWLILTNSNWKPPKAILISWKQTVGHSEKTSEIESWIWRTRKITTASLLFCMAIWHWLQAIYQNKSSYCVYSNDSDLIQPLSRIKDGLSIQKFDLKTCSKTFLQCNERNCFFDFWFKDLKWVKWGCEDVFQMTIIHIFNIFRKVGEWRGFEIT